MNCKSFISHWVSINIHQIDYFPIGLLHLFISHFQGFLGGSTGATKVQLLWNKTAELWCTPMMMMMLIQITCTDSNSLLIQPLAATMNITMFMSFLLHGYAEAGRQALVNNGKCYIFRRVRMGYRSHYWLWLQQALGLFLSHSFYSLCCFRGTSDFTTTLSPVRLPPFLSESTLPSASLQILPPSLPGSPDCDAWLSVVSKSPLVAGTRLPPLQQTEIKTQSMAAQRAAWKWEASGKRELKGGERERGGWMWKHLEKWPELRVRWV